MQCTGRQRKAWVICQSDNMHIESSKRHHSETHIVMRLITKLTWDTLSYLYMYMYFVLSLSAQWIIIHVSHVCVSSHVHLGLEVKHKILLLLDSCNVQAVAAVPAAGLYEAPAAGVLFSHALFYIYIYISASFWKLTGKHKEKHAEKYMIPWSMSTLN